MPPPVIPPAAVGDDRLAAVYQLNIHLVGISSHICRRVLVRGDTTLAELHHVFQVATRTWRAFHLLATNTSTGWASTPFSARW